MHRLTDWITREFMRLTANGLLSKHFNLNRSLWKCRSIGGTPHGILYFFPWNSLQFATSGSTDSIVGQDIKLSD
jgi:hypothetical protein